MVNKAIPNIVIARLPIYLRALTRMMQQGRQVTSSQELGERLGISAAQIRKDLSQFGVGLLGIKMAISGTVGV